MAYKSDNQLRIELYKMTVDAAFRMDERRHNINRFYFTVVLTLFAGAWAIFNFDGMDKAAGLKLASGPFLLACILAKIWGDTLRFYRCREEVLRLIARDMEDEFPEAPLTLEHRFRMDEISKKDPTPFLEDFLPKLFYLLIYPFLGILCFVILAEAWRDLSPLFIR